MKVKDALEALKKCDPESILIDSNLREITCIQENYHYNIGPRFSFQGVKAVWFSDKLKAELNWGIKTYPEHWANVLHIDEQPSQHIDICACKITGFECGLCDETKPQGEKINE